MSTHSTRTSYLGSQTKQVKVRRGAWATLRAMLEARRTRHLLARMDDRMLADIGVGRGDASTESARSIWDIDRI